MIVVAPGRFIILLLQTDASYVRKQLPGPLVCLCSCTMNLADSLMSSWTISELLDIVRPLLGRRAENWTFELRNARLWLFQRKALPRGMEEDKRLGEFAIELARYEAMGKKRFCISSKLSYRRHSS